MSNLRFACLLVVAACRRDEAPAPSPAPGPAAAAGSAVTPPVVDAAQGPSCSVALTVWSAPAGTTTYQGRRDEALLEATDWFTDPARSATCSDTELAGALAAAIGRLDDSMRVDDQSGGDGPILEARHFAVDILRALSGRDFGRLHAAVPNQPGMPRHHGPVRDELYELEDTITLVGWRAWWDQVKAAPGAAIALGRRAASGQAIEPFVFAPAVRDELARMNAKRKQLEAAEPADTARAEARYQKMMNDAKKAYEKRAKKMVRDGKISQECLDNPLAKGCF